MQHESLSSRMAYLLGELRREMNGAVVGSMRYYGKEYGLNYGVSIPTIRTIGRTYKDEHRFAKYLFEQQVRELRLVSLWMASAQSVGDELDFWAKGIVNSEVAEEAAFVCFKRVANIDSWLYQDDELLQYCALLSLSGGTQQGINHTQRIVELLAQNPKLLPKAVVSYIEASIKSGATKESITAWLDELPDTPASSYIREEIRWRLE
ncbi:MAG: DNA alkylation repair protein [Rikenellaceae bacterium]